MPCRAFVVILLFMPSIAIASDVYGPGASEPDSPSEWYGEGVRPTEPRSPEEELAGFHVPPGFVVELVAAEPDIQKPLNIAFDAQGRLWVTNTIEYPYPAPDDRPPRDSIRILEDENRDGQFEKVTTFADELNIPIGIVPIAGGAIAFSIPNLTRFADTDRDGVCDEHSKVLGPFDTSRDTHGMVNSLRNGIDGWIYACHGFNNQSKVLATDGSEVVLSSGNSFRFRSDGSRVEPFTFGQVNPFGMTCDRWGNWFTADCHSKPISQLLRGGYYSSFGRSDDGLGFVPAMMEHSHGSTAICGLEIYEAEEFPEGYRRQFYSGNVMTSRINRNAIEEHGATVSALELADFLTSDDPWFRPVDIQLGPDGGLYVADFYNKIIGHYEVPLTHPGRDRNRGRIWRISYHGGHREGTTPPRIFEASPDEGDFELLSHSNATQRRLARERIRQMDDSRALEPLNQGLRDSNPFCRVECCWELARRSQLADQQCLDLLRDDSAMVRAHAVRSISEGMVWSENLRKAVGELVEDTDARVVRFAVEAIGRNPEAMDVRRLLGRLETVPEDDPILRQSIRIAVRDILMVERIAADFDAIGILRHGNTADALAEILLGLHTPTAANWLLSYLSDESRPIDSMLKMISHVATWSSDEDLPRLIDLLKRRSNDFRFEQELFLLAHRVAGKRSDAALSVLKGWGEEIAAKWYQQLLTMLAEDSFAMVSWSSEDGDSWPSQVRAASDGVNHESYRSSLPRGERYTGSLNSDSFACPPSLSFWLVGHNGRPKEPDSRKNHVRLVDDLTQKVIDTAYPPRSDIARRVEWDLNDWKERLVHLECIDGDDGRAYAWIGIGRFDHPALQTNPLEQHLQFSLEIIRAARPASLEPVLLEIAKSDRLNERSRCEIIEAWATLRGDIPLSKLALAARTFDTSPEVVQQLMKVAIENSTYELGFGIIKQIAFSQSLPQQGNLAKFLSQQRDTLPWLLIGIRDGWMSMEVLRNSAVMQGIDNLASPVDREWIQTLLLALPSVDPRIEELAKKVVLGLEHETGDSRQGLLLFEKHCANCHQLNGRGALVGPQLDGAVARAPSRLLEDILVPDQNVDHAFRVTTLLIEGGLVRVGVVRYETSDYMEIVENNGQIARIDVSTISDRKAGQRSLMPSGMQDMLGEQGLIDLLTYLISNRASPKK